MLAACVEWGLSGFFSDVFGALFLLSTFFSRFRSFSFLGDGLLLEENSQRAVKSKTINLPAVQGN